MNWRAAFLTISIGVLTGLPAIARGAEENSVKQRPAALVAAEDLQSQLSEYRHTELFQHPHRKAVFAANCEDDPAWWGRFAVFHKAGGKIDWVAEAPPIYQQWEGHYIVSLAWRQFAQPKLTVLEVVTSTHMGNGFLWLFALEGHTLRPLLHTPALGFADSPALRKDLPAGETKFAQPVTIRYPRHAHGEPVAVQLSGTVVVENVDTGEILARKPIHRTWVWDPKQRIFHLSHHPKKKGAR